MDTGLIVMIGRGVAKRGRRDDLIDLLRSIAEQDEKEVGTVMQAFHCERDNPNVFWEYNVYRSAEARAIHREHIAPFVAQMDDLWEQWPYMRAVVPLAAKGLQ
jgi:quinol monooxygenase YgiN